MLVVKATFTNGKIIPDARPHWQEGCRLEIREESHLSSREQVKQEEFPVAEFYQPVEHNWSQSDYEVEQALINYSENTHADH